MNARPARSCRAHMKLTPRAFAALTIVALAPAARNASAADAPAAAGPPVAPVRVVVDDYHGTKVEDPYRYMENFTDPAVQAWVKGQAEFAERTLRAIPGRDALRARIRELDEGAPYRIRPVRRWANGDLHYLKRLASENL